MSQKLTKNTNYSIYGHTYFAHNSAIFWPNGLKFFVGTRDTIIYRLVKRNRGYDLNSKSSIFRPFLAGKWAWPPYRRLGVWSLKTRPKSSPTVGSIWAASYLKIMFQKFFTLDPPLKVTAFINLKCLASELLRTLALWCLRDVCCCWGDHSLWWPRAFAMTAACCRFTERRRPSHG